MGFCLINLYRPNTPIYNENWKYLLRSSTGRWRKYIRLRMKTWHLPSYHSKLISEALKFCLFYIRLSFRSILLLTAVCLLFSDDIEVTSYHFDPVYCESGGSDSEIGENKTRKRNKHPWKSVLRKHNVNRGLATPEKMGKMYLQARFTNVPVKTYLQIKFQKKEKNKYS